MRRVPLWAMLFAVLLSACLPGLDDDEEPTQTPIIITATPPAAANTQPPTAVLDPTATLAAPPTLAANPTATPAPSPTSAPTATALALPSATQAPTATTAPGAGEVEIVQSGYGQSAPGEVIGWGLLVQNTHQELAVEDLEYRVIFFNAAGVVVETDEGSVALIFPGERTGIAGTIFVEDGVAAASMDIQITPGTTTTVEVAEGFAVDTVSYFEDEFFPLASALITNPLPSIVTELTVSAITFDAAGNINGGGSTYLAAALPAGKTGAAVSVDGAEDVASVEVFATLSYFSEVLTPNPATDPLVTQFGFGQEPESVNVGWGALIQNPNAAELIRDSELLIWFQDADGRVLDSDYAFLEIIPAGTTIGFGDDLIFLPEGTTAATMTVFIRPGSLEPSDLTDWFTSAGAAYVDDDFFPEVTGTITNPFAVDYEDLYASAIAYDDAGNIIGGGYTYVDFALANASTEVSISVTVGALPARVEIYVYPSGLTDF